MYVGPLHAIIMYIVSTVAVYLYVRSSKHELRLEELGIEDVDEGCFVEITANTLVNIPCPDAVYEAIQIAKMIVKLPILVMLVFGQIGASTIAHRKDGRRSFVVFLDPVLSTSIPVLTMFIVAHEAMHAKNRLVRSLTTNMFYTSLFVGALLSQIIVSLVAILFAASISFSTFLTMAGLVAASILYVEVAEAAVDAAAAKVIAQYTGLSPANVLKEAYRETIYYLSRIYSLDAGFWLRRAIALALVRVPWEHL